MTTYAADTFTRADNASSMGNAETGGAWTANVGTWGIINNAAYRPAGTADNHHRATLSVAQNDVTVSCDVGLSATLNRAHAGIVVRYTDANNWLGVSLIKSTAIANSISVDQLVAGAYTSLANVTSAGLVNGQVYALKVILAGTNISVYVDAVQRVAPTAFNGALTTQKYGITMYRGASDYDNQNSYYDNFLITDNEPDALIPRLNPLLNANIYRM